MLSKKQTPFQISKNKIAFVVIAVVFIISIYFWIDAKLWVNKIEKNELWYSEPTVSRMERDYAYDLAFKKIILIGAFIFSGTALFFAASET